MKKLIALLTALLLALLLVTPALAEDAATEVEAAAEEAGEAVEAAAEEAGEAAEEAAAEVEAAAEEAGEAVAEEAEAAVEEAAEEEAPAVSPVFKKLLEVPWYTWVVLAALVVAAILLALSTKNAKWDSRQISMGAMCIAIAFVLSCIRLFRMPQGGSITPAAMLPLILFMVACGPLKGFVVGCAYGLLQLITDPYVIHPIQLLVDYPLAYGAMILGCLAVPSYKQGNKRFKLTDDVGKTTGYVENIPGRIDFRLPIAVLLAGIGRYIMAVLSGAIFFSEYAGEQNAWVYSLVYNISYLGPDTLVCMLIACIPGMPRLVEMIRKKG